MKLSKTNQRILVLALSVVMTGCLWQNRSGLEKAKLEAIGSPSSIAEIVNGIQYAEANQKRVKMAGTSTSYSDVVITGDNQYLGLPHNLNKPLLLNVDQLKPSIDDSKLVRVMSGMTIKDLNQYLENRKGLGLPNMGGWDGQTVAGVMMTATHGSGLDYGPIESIVQSMQVVVAGGKVIQVEPSNGITDPNKFVPFVDENKRIPMTLVQDDDTFNAMKVSLGSMGVVYSMVLKTVDFFWIKERREVTTWEKLNEAGGFMEKVTSGNYQDLRHPDHPEWGAPDFFEFQVNPYNVPNKTDRNVLLTMRWKVNPLLPENYNIKAPISRGQFGNEFSSFLATQFEKIIAAVVEGGPNKIPAFIDNTLKLQSEGDRVYQNKSYKVFNIGVVNDTEVYGIELSGDVSKSVEYIEKTMELLQNQLTNNKRVVGTPLAVRFVRESDALIAMQNLNGQGSKHSVHLEINNLKDISYSKQLMIDLQAGMMNIGMRPHWGLTIAGAPEVQGEQHVIDMYGSNWSKWKNIMRTYNPNGTFDGRFTDRLGISK